MAAQFKSNVRLREEKGFGSVSMKRLIFCGVGAVLIFMLLRFTPLAGIALPVLVVAFVTLLVVTGARGGLPLWHRVLLALRGTILLGAAHHPGSPADRLARLLNLDPGVVYLHQQSVFHRVDPEPDVDWREWAIFADLDEAERVDGLRFTEEVVHGEPL